MPAGKVKWFNPTKGFGFIQPDDGGPDVFVHISAVERCGLRTLDADQAVEFDLATNRQGKLTADNLKVRPGPSATSGAHTGKVKWFNASKGYGFIEPDVGRGDVFVHISAVEQAGLSTLNENQRVEYQVVTGRNGKAAAERLKLR